MCEVVWFDVRMVGGLTRLKANDASRLRMQQNWTQTESLVVHHVTKQVFKYLHAQKNNTRHIKSSNTGFNLAQKCFLVTLPPVGVQSTEISMSV